MQPRFTLGAMFLFLLALATPALAECSAASGPSRTALLELYTSEGCSSCPPADRWLSGIAAAGLTADKVVPLAFHVDYWDYIGWKDRFAQPVFTARQHETAAFNRQSFVYTPQVLLNGKDFRGWANASRFGEAIAAIHREPSRASIRLDLEQSADAVAASVTVQAGKPGKAALYVALYENGLVSTVKAGENSGATLHHDYVVREWLGPYDIDSLSATPWQRKIPLRADWKTQNMGAAAFVQDRATGEILQALSLDFCH